MLILTRRTDEAIVIRDDITVTVIGVKGNQVRLAIEAPKDVSVHREEIHKRLKTENKIYTDNHAADIFEGKE